MKKVVLLSGVPGSGKSTYTKSLTGNVVVCSADHHFIGEDGVYRFDFTKLRHAHGNCLRKFMGYMVNSWCDVLVVDNTNTTALELAPYVAVASAYDDVEIEVVTVLCDPVKAHGRNTHGVPLEGVKRMDAALRARELPPYWPVTIKVIEN